MDNFLVVLTDGELTWDKQAADFNWDRTSALPRLLSGAFISEPIWVDLRWARPDNGLGLHHPRFREAVADLAAPLRGVPKEDLIGEDVRHHQRALRLAAAAVSLLALLLAASIGAGIYANNRRIEAQEQAAIARTESKAALSRQLAIQADIELSSGHSLDLGFLLAAAAVEIDDNGGARRALLRALLSSPHLERMIYDNDSILESVDFSSSGRVLITSTIQRSESDYKSGFALWDRLSGKPTARIAEHLPSALRAITTGQDGRIVATANCVEFPEDELCPGSIELWDAETGDRIGPPWPPRPIGALAISSDGTKLASGSGRDATLILWDAQNRVPLWEVSHVVPNWIESIVFSRDGQTLAVGDGQSMLHGGGTGVVVFDISGPQPVRKQTLRHEFMVSGMAFTPGGTTLATAGPHGVSLWNVTGEQPSETIIADWFVGYDVAFSDDGRFLVAGGYAGSSGVLLLWDLNQPGSEGVRLVGQSGDVRDVAFQPGSGTFASVTGSTIAIWSASPSARLTERRVTTSDAAVDATVTEDGERVVMLQRDGLVLVADGADTAARQVATINPVDVLLPTAMTNDGSFVAQVLDEGGSIAVWDIRGDQPKGQLIQNPVDVSTIAFGPDNQLLAVGGRDGSITLWSLPAGRLVTQSVHHHDLPPISIVFSQDGRAIASVDGTGPIKVADAAALELLGPPIQPEPLYRGGLPTIALGPDGRTLVFESGGLGSDTFVVDVHSGRTKGVMDTNGNAFNIAISSDGKVIATADSDAVTLWDGRNLEKLGDPFDAGAGAIFDIGFGAGSDRLLVAGEDGIVLLTTSVDQWIDRACTVVNRELTADEWGRFLPGHTDWPVCPLLTPTEMGPDRPLTDR